MDEDYFCPECGYQGAAGDCPYCHVPMQSVQTDDFDNLNSSPTYSKELLKKEENSLPFEEDDENL